MNSADSLVGTRIGPYDILSLIGVGGMGEVYRARDTDLQRDVAIKVLPAALVADRDRLARFEREARVLASLNHPHISAIYGIERGGAAPALVLELVEGDGLEERLRRGPLPVDEALRVARQIAEALEAAHAKGIVHRDLKPANIKITPNGTVKVLDFGLAKMGAGGAGKAGGVGETGGDPTHAATVTVDGTRAGMILGTAAYMSPEQARGFDVDQRTDVWAFGCVLFEMITGQKPFPGGTMSDQLVAILEREPDWGALPPATPERVRTLLRRCLEKDAAKRLDRVDVAQLAFDEKAVGDRLPYEFGRRTRTWLSWSVAAASIAVSLAIVRVMWRQPTAQAESARLLADLGGDAYLVNFVSSIPAGSPLALSPDGTVFVFAGVRANEQSMLYVRRLSEKEPAPRAGTTGARDPFFSPDGQWIGFFADGSLKKIPLGGGVAVTLADAPDQRGGAWSPDGTIAFMPGGKAGTNLMQVSSSGGATSALTTLGSGEVTHRWPQFLRGGKVVLYTTSARTGAFNDADIAVQELPTGVRKVVHRSGYYGRYLESGHLLFFHDGAMFAEPFDINRLEATGPSVAIAADVFVNILSGFAHVTFSANGTLAYTPRRALELPLNWAGRDGQTTALRATAADWGNPSISPDGRRIAMEISKNGQSDVWTYDWANDSMRQSTFDRSSSKPVWTPDGSRIVFASRRDNEAARNLYWMRVDGTGEVQRLTTSGNDQLPWSWHPNGRLLSFQETGMSGDVMVLPLDGDEASGWNPGRPAPFVNTPAHELGSAFSPDGRWLAYQSNETGRFEVYVRPYPGPGGKWIVSSGGGVAPRWSRTRPELLYAAGDQIMAALYSTAGALFNPDKPQPWTPVRTARREDLGNPFTAFDLHPDGDRIAIASAADAPADARQRQVVFLLNAFDELRRLAPPR